MKNYNDFCRGRDCVEYIEWDYVINEYGGYQCTSCKKVGQSYDIEEYPDDCCFSADIKKITLEARE